MGDRNQKVEIFTHDHINIYSEKGCAETRVDVSGIIIIIRGNVPMTLLSVYRCVKVVFA